MIQKLAEPALLYLFFFLSLYQSLTLLCRKFGHCKYLILFFFLAILLEIFLLAWDHRPVSSPKFSVALALRQTASHLTLKYFCKARSSWSIQWLQGDRVLWSSSSSCLHCVWQLVWSGCADVLCLLFAKHSSAHYNSNALHYDQTSPLTGVLWIFQMQRCKSKLCSHVLLKDKRIFPSFQTKLVHFFLIVLSCTLRFNMLTEAWRSWEVAVRVFTVCRWPWRTSTPGRTDSCLECFPFE